MTLDDRLASLLGEVLVIILVFVGPGAQQGIAHLVGILGILLKPRILAKGAATLLLQIVHALDLAHGHAPIIHTLDIVLLRRGRLLTHQVHIKLCGPRHFVVFECVLQTLFSKLVPSFIYSLLISAFAMFNLNYYI